MKSHQFFIIPDGYDVKESVIEGLATTLIAPAVYKRIFIYLHGNGGTIASWKYVLQEIFQVDASSAHLFLDLPNHGASARSTHPQRPLAQHEFLAQIQSAIEQALPKRTKEVVIVGHCLGGMIAQLLIQSKPSYYTHMILINAGSKIPAFLNLFRIPPMPWLIRLAEAYWPASWYEQKDVLLEKKRYVRDIDLIRLFFDIKSVGAKYYFQIGKFIQKIPFEEVASKIDQPVLIIAGENDVYYSKKTTSSFVLNFQCATLLLIKNGGHMAIFNNPKEIAHAFSSFLHI